MTFEIGDMNSVNSSGPSTEPCGNDYKCDVDGHTWESVMSVVGISVLLASR